MHDRRAVSAVVGVILITGLTLVTVTAILAVGSAVLVDAQADATTSQMENSMSQMASKASLVALGESDGQQFDVGDIGEGDLTVDPDAGYVEIHHYTDGDPEVIFAGSLGAVTYTQGDETIAYQGGGVWKGLESGSTMLSPPEYHYKHRTLTFPIVRITEGADSHLRTTGFVSREGQERLYPNPEEGHVNPVDEGNITVTITSEYHHAWNDYFEERSEGVIDHDESSETVTVDLTVPLDAPYGNPVAATSRDPGIDRQGGGGNDDVYDEWVEGADEYPSPSNTIAEKVDTISDGEEEYCDETGIGSTNTFDGGTVYCSTETVTASDWTFETNGEDITVVVDGGIDVDGDITVTGDGTVELYLRDGFAIAGGNEVNMNEETDAAQFQVYIHSDATSASGDDPVELSGNPAMNGLIYAPNSMVNLDGNVEFTGTIIGYGIRDNGAPATGVEADAALEDVEIEFGDLNAVRYLHISDNQIKIES